MESRELLRNLMIMAFADGVLTDEEMEMLQRRRRQWDIPQAEFDAVLEEARSPSASLVVPENENERYDVMADLVAMMGADGEFSDFEKQLLAIAAVRFDIEAGELDEILDEFTDHDDDLVL